MPGTARGRLRLSYWEPPLIAMAMFLTFVLARYMQWGARREILAKIRVEFLLGLALTVTCIAIVSSSPIAFAKLRQAKKVLLAIVLLFVMMLIQIPFAAARAHAQEIFVDRVIKFAMLTFFMLALIRSPKALRWFITAFLFACFYITQESARGALSGSLLWENQGIMRLHGAVPIYGHPNSLAGLSIGLVPFIVFLLPAVRRRWVQLMMLAPLGTASICLLYSGSRTGYVAFFSFMLFWWSQSRKKLRWLLIMLAVGAVALPLLPDQYKERFMSIKGEEAQGHSKEKRIEIIEDALVILAENPIGVGVASFQAVREERFGRIQDTHNLYLEVATNLGLQGFVVFCILLVAMFQALRHVRRRLDRMLKWCQSPEADALVPARRLESMLVDLSYLRAVSLATEAFLVVRLALGLFGMDLYEVYWWFAAGLCISLEVIAARVDTFIRARVAEQPLGAF